MHGTFILTIFPVHRTNQTMCKNRVSKTQKEGQVCIGKVGDVNVSVRFWLSEAVWMKRERMGKSVTALIGQVEWNGAR